MKNVLKDYPVSICDFSTALILNELNYQIGDNSFAGGEFYIVKKKTFISERNSYINHDGDRITEYEYGYSETPRRGSLFRESMDNREDYEIITAPNYEDIFKWLLNKQNIYVSPYQIYDKDDDCFYWTWRIYMLNNKENNIITNDIVLCDTYKTALHRGIVLAVSLLNINSVVKKSQNENPKSPWIKCSERMPMSGTDYLPFVDKWGNHYFGRFENGSWYTIYGYGCEIRVDYDDVIAWMPISKFKEE